MGPQRRAAALNKGERTGSEHGDVKSQRQFHIKPRDLGITWDNYYYITHGTVFQFPVIEGPNWGGCHQQNTGIQPGKKGLMEPKSQNWD